MKTLFEISQGAYATFETCQNTYDSAILASNMEGDFVECGVAAGAQIAIMKKALHDTGVKKIIWAFDSYEGIPFGIKDKDIEQPGIGLIKDNNNDGKLASTGITKHLLQDVIDSMNYSFEVGTENIQFIKGWFQQTLVGFNKKISLLRLDGDLYESTKVCLENLFPLVINGGIVIIDDIALHGCRLACDEYFSSIGYEPNYLPINNSYVKYFFK